LAAAELEEVKLVWEEKLLPEADQPLTQQDRDELAADTYKKTELMRRQEHSCFREFFRLGTLLIKLQAEESSAEQTKHGKKRGETQQPDSDCDARAVDPNRPSEGASPTATRKNAGASGDVDENKGGEIHKEPDFRRHAPKEVVETRDGRAKTAAQQASL